MKIEDIAKVAHEMNRAYALAIGEDPRELKSWEKSTQEVRDSAITGVQKIISTPSLTPEESHQSWCEYKTAHGWKWGAVKDSKEKTHPCLVAYSDLPEVQRHKDRIFGFVVRMLAGIK